MQTSYRGGVGEELPGFHRKNGNFALKRLYHLEHYYAR
jgi:hypothetical protein